MLPLRVFRRSLSTERNDIGSIFRKENVQKLLIDITRFDEKIIFAPRPVQNLKSAKLMFMTDKQLAAAKQDAYDNVKARLQMPPVMAADNSAPRILSKDPELVGYTKHKIMFVDIGHGYSNRNRLMSVREPDGTLRFPTHEERARLNHIFYPSEVKSIDIPKMFEGDNLVALLKRKEYKYILDRACIQFEPDDPRYVEVTSRVYEFINNKGDHDMLRSTRHFGPMSLYLAYNHQADDLIVEMLSKDLVEDAAKLVKIYYTCHNIAHDPSLGPIDTLRNYAESHSNKKYNLDLALKRLDNQRPPKGAGASNLDDSEVKDK